MTLNEKKPGDCGYIAFWKGKRVEVYGPTLLAAQNVVVKHFKVKKPWEVNIMIAERADGSEVIHRADF